MDVKETFDSLRGTGLQREDFHENMTWDEYVQELAKLSTQDTKLKELIHMKNVEDLVEDATLERIMASNFMSAKEVIDQMTISKRITMLEEVHQYRAYLYESMSVFGMEGVPKDEQLSAKDFRVLLGRVKHLEILMNWLYGII